MGSGYANKIVGAAPKAIEQGKNFLVGGTIGGAAGLALKGILGMKDLGIANFGKLGFFVAGSAAGAIMSFAAPVMADVLNPSELANGELPKDKNGNTVMPPISAEWKTQLQ